MMLFWIIYFLTLLQILRDAVLLNWHIPSSWVWSRKYESDSVPHMKEVPDIILLLPVLREQQQLQRALHALKNLAYPGRKQIIVVTTEREIAENKGEIHGTTIETTINLLATLQQDTPVSYRHIHAPKVIGNKATQLNYALQEIIQSQMNLSTTYIGVYDADSRPASNTLLHLLKVVAQEENGHRPWPIALQQPALFLGNFQSLSWYLQLEALFQTRWVLGQELRALRASIRSSSHAFAPYAYCVGHGMFIRADFLQQTGGFPEPSEDVPLGHRLTFLGIPIHPLPVYDVCEVVHCIPALIRQSGFWFCNAPLIWREYAHVKQLHLPTNKVRSAILLLKGIMDIFSWVHYPLHFLSLLFLLLCGIPAFYAFLSILVCYLDVGVGMVLMISLFPACSPLALGERKSIRLKKSVWLILCSPLRNIVRGAAPFLACWYVTQSLILKRVNVLPKTMK